MKNVLVIKIGTKGISDALADSYVLGAKKVSKVKIINLSEIKFDPVLHVGKGNQKLEKDLVLSQKLISWANHIVLIYPNWWATMPALLKGFFDRTFTPKFAFEYRNHLPLGLLKGKTGFVVCVTAAPKIYNLIMGVQGLVAIRKNIFGFCGIKTKTKYINSSNKLLKDKEKYEKLKQEYFNYGKNLK